MSKRAPIRQVRGKRATLPAAAAPPPCGDSWREHELNVCRCWHLYDECPCFLVEHMESHPAAGCACKLEAA
ncbi:hypothetical protein [Streptomyces sp. NPDC004528]|uniref:hypothetical protein n=1 Tax=Streptomyces sp. NPDC004528 TaxID=3154550 RepID=UPI00339E9DA7